MSGGVDWLFKQQVTEAELDLAFELCWLADDDGRYFTEAESDARYYDVGEQVADADTVDGQYASAFATAGHDHGGRYLRRGVGRIV